MILKVIIAISMLAQFSFAANLTQANQLSIVNEVAKKVRRDLYVNGFTNVETNKPERMTQASMNEFYKENNNTEFALNKAEYAQLYSCLNSRTCALWHFGSYSSMYGGSGGSHHFVLMNVKSGRYKLVEHVAFEE